MDYQNTTMDRLVDYKFVREGDPEPELPECLYQYLVGRDGIYIRARREGLIATIGLTGFIQPARGLAEIKPGISFVEAVPASFLKVMVDYARNCLPKECLFYLVYQKQSRMIDPWMLVIPKQEQTPANVRPVDAFSASARTALVEVHSHGYMNAFFSATDNRDETGFRIYAVLGRLDQPVPSIGVRIGVYGHFCPVPANLVFEMPDEWQAQDIHTQEVINAGCEHTGD